MSELFEIPLLNPMRFIGATGTKFDSLPAVELINIYQERKCYFQKWQSSDSTRLQILSDFPDITFKIFDLDSGQKLLDIVPLEQDVTLIGHTFKVYEIPLDFALLPEGDYYAELSYMNGGTISFLSEPFSVREIWDNTLLFNYRNSDNNFSIVFDTGITFDIRLEGVVTEFAPQSEDTIYNDQKHNATMLDSVPWRQFKLYIGDAPGIPAWVADKVNRVMSCNQVQIDGDYFEKIEGAAWEVERADEYAYMGLTLDIMPVENFFLQRLQTGDDDMTTIKVVQKANNYFDVTGALSVPGIFDRYTKLDELVIENDGDPFTLKVGLTEGGNEIGEFQVNDANTTIDIDYYFRVNATLYLSGYEGELPLISVIWKELDPDPIDVGGGGTPRPGNLGIGAVIIYEADETKFNSDFDLSSGLGREDTDWFGWAVCDGRNGTVNRGGRMPVGWMDGHARWGTLGAAGGAEKFTINKENLPNIQLDVPIPREQTSRHDTGSGRITTGGAEIEPIAGPTLKTNPLGSGNEIDNMPPYVVSIFVKKIS